jgi:hypothetical protein
MAVCLDPPRNGEGDREAVEGAVEAALSASILRMAPAAPSVSRSGCHLPVPGRI